MKVSKKITKPVDKAYVEFREALDNAIFALLPLLGERGEDIKLETPISLAEHQTKSKTSLVSVVYTAVVSYISYVPPTDGYVNSGIYFLQVSTDPNSVVSSNIDLTFDDRIKVYEVLKAMVRHKA